MARARRKARPRRRVDLELLGLAALGCALFLGVALIAPPRTGLLGRAVAHGLHVALGLAAPSAPTLLALLGAIVFLEINVPRLIASYGTAALLYMLALDALLGRRGGAIGTTLAQGLGGLLGETGAVGAIVLGLAALTAGLCKVSLKRAIGRVVLAGLAARDALARGAARRAERAAATAGPRPALVAPTPTTLREAFSLPEKSGRMRTRAGASAAAVAIPRARTEIDRRLAVDRTELAELLLEDDRRVEYFDDPDDLDDRDAVVVAHANAPEVAAASVVRPPDAPPPLVATSAAPAARGQLFDGTTGRPIDDDEPEAPGEPRKRTYRLPPLSLFDPPQVQLADDSTRTAVLEDTLASFGVGAKVLNIQRGPSITRYELKPDRGVKISRISALADDLALALAATSVRIEAPIPGKSAVGIEIPNAVVSVVALREILESLPQRGTVPPLPMALGKDITGRPVFGDLGKMPHLLVAGATGSGKSVCLNTIIASLLVCATPDQVQMLMIDPKRVELTVYNGIPHLVKEVITDARLAAGALFEMTKEMDSRYERFAKASVRKIEEYNAKFPDEKLPYVVIVIDELADLMLIAPAKVETTICRIAQLARATGIHLVVATQRPSVDVITGIIKANIPSRIAFAVSSQVDSRTILDMVGAERLLGRGDMLYLPIDAPKPVRSQGALITGEEVARLVEFWAAQARPENLLDVELVPIGDDEPESRKAVDPLCYEAAKFIIETQYASTAQLQSRFSVGHPRAVRVMKHLEDFGVVGPHEGTKPRQINIGLGDLETIAGRMGRDETEPELFSAG